MIKYLIGMVGALGGMLVGGWLMLAPFALAYQPSGVAWADPTYVDFWSGLAILVVSLFGLVSYVLGLMEESRRQGIIERGERPREQQVVREVQAVSMPESGGTGVGSGDIEQLLLPLVTAMLKDMQDRQQQERSRDHQRQEEADETARVAAPKWRIDPERRA